MDYRARIEALRSRCLARKRANTRWLSEWGRSPLTDAASLRASEGRPWQRRVGLRTRDRLRAVRFVIDDLEPLAGRRNLSLPEPAAADVAAASEYLRQFPVPGGQTGHCELDYPRLLALGVDGLRAEITTRAAGATGPAADVYASFLDGLDGLTALCQNAVAAIEDALPGASPERRRELQELGAGCAHVAHAPPASFREALQLVWFALVGATLGDDSGLTVAGHLDRTVLRFYEADRAADRLTREEALFLLEAFYLLTNDFTPDGLATSVMVGGRDVAGRDVTNDLSYLCLEALRRTRLIYPTVGICWHECTPADLSVLAVELIADGCPNPAFFGDETIQRGLRGLGVPPEEACNYINSTCVEITPVGGSNVWVASPYFSVCHCLLEELADQAPEGRAAPSFATFVERYRQRLAGQIAAATTVENEHRRARRQYGGKPLQSVLTRDCVARGRDIDDGGARYNWVECSFVGLANLVDSLAVIRAEVYDEKRLSFAELKALLDSDFAEHEDVRQRFLRGHPKYGNQCAAVDGLLGELIAFLQKECARHQMVPNDSAFVPGAFCWVMHEQLGRACGATPDGRHAGVPFADGCGPAQGREQQGPTAAVLSTTSWEHSPMIGGLAFNMKFGRQLFTTAEARRRLQDLIVTFLRRGGFETQINVVDAAILRRARATPEAYADLVVRIGGYTDYFTRLSPGMQDEVILRTEYEHV